MVESNTEMEDRRNDFVILTVSLQETKGPMTMLRRS